MTTERKGDPYQTPLLSPARASRQTAATTPSSRSDPRRAQPVVADEDENPDAWTVEKPHTSAYRYDLPARQTGKTTTRLPPKPTQVLPSRRFQREHLILWCGLA